MTEVKKKLVDELNRIQESAQDIFFKLEQFAEHDPGPASLIKTIELIDEISKIRNRVMKSTNETNGKDEHKD